MLDTPRNTGVRWEVVNQELLSSSSQQVRALNKIMEWFGQEGTLKLIHFHPLPWAEHLSLVLSNLALDISGTIPASPNHAQRKGEFQLQDAQMTRNAEVSGFS